MKLGELCVPRFGITTIKPMSATNTGPAYRLRLSALTGNGIDWTSYSRGGGSARSRLRPGDILAPSPRLYVAGNKGDLTVQPIDLVTLVPMDLCLAQDILCFRPLAGVRPAELLLRLRRAYAKLALVATAASPTGPTRQIEAMLDFELPELPSELIALNQASALENYYEQHDRLQSQGLWLNGGIVS